MGHLITDVNGNRVPFEAGGIGKVVETITANRTLRVEDSGKVFLVGTDALTITLPATVKGLDFTFINSGAAGNNIITISPAAADGIAGTITLASSVVTRVGTVDTDLVNTKATSTLGNSVRIVGTGVTGTGAYFIVSSTGIWA
jgi:hypothetical protein